MSHVNIYILLASGRLKPYEKELKTVINKYYRLVKKKIFLENIDFVVIDRPEETIPHQGVGGFTPNAYTVYLYLDPKFREFEKTITEYLPRTVAHELHHAARWASIGYGTTLLEAAISEGLADHFDIEITGQKPQVWDTAFTEKKITEFLKKAEKEFWNTTYNHQEWFFGSVKRGVPKWAGYALGFYLVQKYLEQNPNKKASTLCSAKAKIFWKKK